MQLFCMATCGTPLIWICTETDWQDIAGLVRATNRNLEDPELQAIISKYGGPGALNEIQRRVISS